ncbi:hypothetical protein [uncultured Eubacterium sp.]|nr:hypothetical protein [uncultured Eubacterium sp.]
MKLYIKIKVNEIEELEPVIKYVKKLDINNSPDLNAEVIIELGE